MHNFVEYINSALPDKPGDKLLFKFKKSTLDEMNQRAVEIAGRGGIHDEKVIGDLVKSEHEDLKSEYEAYYAKQTDSQRTKRAVLGNIFGSIAYIVAIITVFLGVSFATDMWKYTWIIVVDGILLWVDYLLSLGIRKLVSMKRIFHVFARILLFGAVIIFSVAAFLLVVALTDLPNSWLIVIVGLALAFVCDGVFALATNARLTVIYWLLYIPIIAAFVFIVIGCPRRSPSGSCLPWLWHS